MNRAIRSVVLLAFTAIGLAVGPAPEPAQKGKEAVAAARLDVCNDAIKMALLMYDRGTGTIDVVVEWSRRLVDSQRAAGLPKDQLTAAIRKHIEFLNAVEHTTDAHLRAGLCSPLDAKAATYARLEAEQWLADAEGR